MINWRFLKSSERKKIEKSLNERFGIEKIPGEIIIAGKERLFLFTGDANESDVRELEKLAPVDRIGVYFAKIVRDDVKLSIEGSQILQNQIKKNIFELDDEQAIKWMKGEELNIKTGKRGFLIMKHKDDFLGSGKASEEKIGNFVPKIRRLRNRS